MNKVKRLIDHKEFKEKCKKAGINYNTAVSYKYQHPKVDDDAIIEMYKTGSGRANSFISKCNKHGLNYKKLIRYRMENKNITDEELIDFGIERGWFKLKDKCDINNISYYKVTKLMKDNNTLSENEAIEIIIKQTKDKGEV